jgi:hypothetical protein
MTDFVVVSQTAASVVVQSSQSLVAVQTPVSTTVSLVTAGPMGPQGPQGIQGAPGNDGADGPANTLTIGTVSTLTPGSSATATVTGTAPNQTLNLGIPQGATGGAFSSTDDNSTAAAYYPLVATAAAGNTVKTSSTKLKYTPSSGRLEASEFVVGNYGLVYNSALNSNFYSAPNSNNAINMFPLPMYVWHDMLAFNRAFGTPAFETFTTVWAADTLNTSIFAGKEGAGANIIDGVTKTAARWTWSTGVAWSSVSWFLIGFTYNPGSTKDVLIESSADNVNWTVRHTSTGNPVNSLPCAIAMNQPSGDLYLRLTITMTSAVPLGISTMKCLTARWGDQGLGSEYSVPYDWDAARNIAVGAGAFASASAVLRVGSSTTTQAGGMSFGTDTFLYRSAVNTLTMSGTLIATTFSGASTTQAVDTNTTALATTAFVLGQAASATPAALGTAAVGTSTRYARADHVHAAPTYTTQTYGDATTNVATTAFVDRLRDVPSVVKSATYTLDATDRGSSVDTTAGVTIPSDTTKPAIAVGATFTITNTSAASITITQDTGCTLRQAGTANTGNRTLAAYGMMTVRKQAANTWFASGAGLT